MMTDITGLCEGCRELKPVAYTDSVGREYCAACAIVLPIPSANRLLEFLMHTIPFKVGDRVEARTAGALFDGVGVIEEVSMSPEKWGTPVYPSFRVRIEEPAYPEAPKERWYMEKQLRKVTDE